MAVRNFPASWVGVYEQSPNRYHTTNTPIAAGGTTGYNTLIGVPSSVREAVSTSKTPARIKIKMRVTTAGGGFSLGGHRETSNKASGTLPWYKYLLRYFNPSAGWAEYDITDQFKSEYMSGSLHGIVLYNGTSSNYAAAHGRTGDSNEFLFIVEGTWNTAPSQPTITAPTSSTIADNQVQVSWNASSDAESSASQLSYEVEYYDGNSWGRRAATGQGATSYTFNSSTFPETSRAQVRVRAFDGELYSSWRTSAQFTISHNRPPTQPTSLDPSGGELFDSSQVKRFTWKHNDDGPQAGYRLQYREVGASSWITIPASGWVNTTNQRRDFSANFFNIGEYEWRVSTMDQQGLESPWSNIQRFKAGEQTQAPIFLQPTSGSIWNTSELVVQWSSINQSSYEMELLENGEVLWSESGGANKATKAGYSLANSRSYTVRLRVLSRESGLWSPWSTITFTTQFIPPQKPLVELIYENGDNTITISWQAQVGETSTAYVEIFRREYSSSGQNEWIRIAKDLFPSGSWVDYTPASDQPYEYKVRAWGSNLTFRDSDTVEGSTIYSDSFLQRAALLTDLLRLNSVEARDEDMNKRGGALFFAGRPKPIYEVGEQEERQLNLTWRVYSPSELRNTLNFVRLHETFLYRDNAGRRFYCVVRNPKVTDRPAWGFDVSVELYEVDYTEGV